MKVRTTMEDGHGNLISDVTRDEPGLGVDRLTTPADGTTQLPVDYCTADPSVTTATWTVNGTVQTEPLDNGTSRLWLRVPLGQTGPVDVQCNDSPIITIQAV